MSDPLLPVDADGDGYASHVDCDDTDDAVYPGATELCDGIDNDCNKYVDDGLMQDYYADADGDGWGNVALISTDCQVPAGYTDNPGDCDDTDDTVYPGTTEVCDGVDNDCDGSIDEYVQTWFYAHEYSDGYRAEDRQRLCGTSPSYPYRSYEAEQDCDDSDPYVGSDSICYSAIDGNGTSVTIGPYCSIEQVDGMYQSVVEVSC